MVEGKGDILKIQSNSDKGNKLKQKILELKEKGLSYTQISDRLGISKSQCARLYTSIEVSEFNTQKIVSNSEELQLRKQLNEIKKRSAFEDLLLEGIRGAAPNFKTPPVLPQIKFTTKKTDTLLKLVFSDHHANQVIDPKSIEYYNSYNFDIYTDRLYSIVKKTIRVAQAQYSHSNNIVGLTVDCLGDIGTDCHRLEHISTNEMAENIASLCTSYIISQAIDCLLRAKTIDDKHYLFPTISFRGVVGNEPRMDKKVNFTEPWRNWDYLIYQHVSMCLGDMKGRLSYHIPFSPKTVVNDMGWNFLLSHGNEVQGWAGIPFYGINRTNAKEQHLRKKDGGFDYHLFGHFHTKAELTDFGTSFICPSLVGVGGYAHNGLGVTGPVGQSLFAITEEHGVIGNHFLHADCDEKSPFVYDKNLIVEGAHKAMTEWRTKN